MLIWVCLRQDWVYWRSSKILDLAAGSHNCARLPTCGWKRAASVGNGDRHSLHWLWLSWQFYHGMVHLSPHDQLAFFFWVFCQRFQIDCSGMRKQPEISSTCWNIISLFLVDTRRWRDWESIWSSPWVVYHGCSRIRKHTVRCCWHMDGRSHWGMVRKQSILHLLAENAMNKIYQDQCIIYAGQLKISKNSELSFTPPTVQGKESEELATSKALCSSGRQTVSSR